MKLYSLTNFTKHKPSNSTLVTTRTNDDPTRSCPVYSEQTEGGLD